MTCVGFALVIVLLFFVHLQALRVPGVRGLQQVQQRTGRLYTSPISTIKPSSGAYALDVSRVKKYTSFPLYMSSTSGQRDIRKEKKKSQLIDRKEGELKLYEL